MRHVRLGPAPFELELDAAAAAAAGETVDRLDADAAVPLIKPLVAVTPAAPLAFGAALRPASNVAGEAEEGMCRFRGLGGIVTSSYRACRRCRMSEIGEEDAMEIHQVMETIERMMHKHARSAHIMHAYTHMHT